MQKLPRGLKGGERGHLGSALSVVDMLRVLYDDVLRHDPARPEWAERDRCLLSKGHGCLALYAVLASYGVSQKIFGEPRRVIFIDAYRGDLPGGFRWSRCEPSPNFEFTPHVLPPRGVLHYCQSLYGARPRADLLMIQGESWGLEIGLSRTAETHLENALGFFRSHVLATR
mgnify:CR=1 FL=1